MLLGAVWLRGFYTKFFGPRKVSLRFYNHGLVVVMVEMEKRRKLLLTMVDSVYVDTLDEKAIVGIQPKPAFLPLFEVSVGEGMDVALFSSTSVALGFGYSQDMNTTSRRLVGVSP